MPITGLPLPNWPRTRWAFGHAALDAEALPLQRRPREGPPSASPSAVSENVHSSAAMRPISGASRPRPRRARRPSPSMRLGWQVLAEAQTAARSRHTASRMIDLQGSAKPSRGAGRGQARRGWSRTESSAGGVLKGPADVPVTCREVGRRPRRRHTQRSPALDAEPSACSMATVTSAPRKIFAFGSTWSSLPAVQQWFEFTKAVLELGAGNELPRGPTGSDRRLRGRGPRVHNFTFGQQAELTEHLVDNPARARSLALFLRLADKARHENPQAARKALPRPTAASRPQSRDSGGRADPRGWHEQHPSPGGKRLSGAPRPLARSSRARS